MTTAPHDDDREFAAWDRLCTALYEARQASFDLMSVAKHDMDKEDAGKMGLQLERMFERRWRTYGWRRQQAREKR